MKHENLRLGDVSIALWMTLHPNSPLKALAESTCRSIGEVHNAEQRLRMARLLKPEGRAVELEPFFQFLRWGVPYAFPPSVGSVTQGIATARLETATVVSDEPGEAEFVWPSASGRTRGQAFAPPYPRATELFARNPELRTMLSLLDLVRIGGAREQSAAMDELRLQIRRKPE